MKFDKYNRTARIYPSIIILLPFLLFTIYCHIDNLKVVFEDLLKLKIVGNITISIVLLYFLVQINRALGKFVFEKSLFRNELEMPTTNFLLFSNQEFSKEYKLQIRAKIKKDFKVELLNENEETIDLENSRKRIVETVGLIRQKVKDGRLLLQHNIEYGFFRNLIGGSIIAFLMSGFDIYYFFTYKDNVLGEVSILFAFCFAILLLVHKPIINHLGNQYAKRLFQEYLQK